MNTETRRDLDKMTDSTESIFNRVFEMSPQERAAAAARAAAREVVSVEEICGVFEANGWDKRAFLSSRLLLKIVTAVSEGKLPIGSLELILRSPGMRDCFACFRVRA